MRNEIPITVEYLKVRGWGEVFNSKYGPGAQAIREFDLQKELEVENEY